MTSLKNTKLTVVIATFNSEKYLVNVLESIRKQTFNQENITILVVDGGSIDKTKTIAKSFGCTILQNRRIEPVSAKLLGYKKATGDFIMFIDADEVLVHKDSIRNKINAILSDSNIKAAIPSGYTTPSHSSIIRHYINEFGDPFSFFIYRISKDARFFIRELKQTFVLKKERKDFVDFVFPLNKTSPIIELGAAGSIIDLHFLKKSYPTFDSYIFAHLFQLLYTKGLEVPIMKNDPLMHYSSEQLGSYLNKIEWRIRNNIFFKSKMGNAGFEGRSEYLSFTDKFKKYLFIPYALMIILPLYDAFVLIFTRKDVRYIMHLVLVEITAWLIIKNYFLLFVGYRPLLKSYDQKKVVRL